MKATSHIFATMRGRVNGIVYTANQFANLIGRQYVIPTNPNSPFQVNARNALQAAVAIWTGFDVVEPPSVFFDPLFVIEDAALSGAPGIRGVAFKISNIQPVAQRMFAQPSVEFGTSRS